jgi:hypothetical protein
MEGFMIGEGVKVMCGVARDEFGNIQVIGVGSHRSSPDCGQAAARAHTFGGNDECLRLIADTGAMKQNLLL